MYLDLIISFILLFSFIIQGVFGFGGLVLFLALILFFLNPIDSIILVLYVSTLFSLFILVKDYKFISVKRMFFIFKFIFIGTIFGIILLDYFSEKILVKIFAIILFLSSIYSLFFKKLKIKTFKVAFLFFGGIMHGIFGTGGSFIIKDMKNIIKNKTEIRVSMALIVLILNFTRVVDFAFRKEFSLEILLSFWWLVFVLILSFYIGQILHKKINDKMYRIGVDLLILLASVLLLFKEV